MSYLKGMEGSGSLVVKICVNQESVAQTAAEMFVEQFKNVRLRGERFSIVLSGGKTPARTYELLANEPFRSQVDWSQIHVFWGDERCVPITDSRSNYGSVKQIFLSRVPIPPRQIHPILCIQDPQKSAVNYETILKEYFGKSPPFFNFIFLGLGKDGHTVSLFPNSSALNEKVRWVTHLQNSTEDFARITLTPQLLNLSQLVVFLVTGQEKAEILKEVLAGSEHPHKLPAHLINPVAGKLIWLVDSLARPSDFKGE